MKSAKEYYEKFEIDNLINIKGKSGLFIIDKVVNNNVVKMYDLLNDKIVISKVTDLSAIKDYNIFMNDGEPITPLDIFEKLSELGQDKHYDFSDYYPTERCTPELMEAVVPGHSEQFKKYHLREIIKWYVDLNKYLDYADKL